MNYSHTILLVDDESYVLKSLKRLLDVEDYLILTAESALAAMKVLEYSPVSLIISDQMMPGLSGLEFFKATVLKYPDIIRIILTGQAELETAIEAINEGCVYKFILKPWNNYDLKITVKRALEQYDLFRQNQDLTREIKQQDLILRELEKKHPGLTKRPKDGIYRFPD